MKNSGRLPPGHHAFWRIVEATKPLRDHPWMGEVFGVCVFAAAFGLRLAADLVLENRFPYITFYPAVLIATFFAGARPGLVCALLSALAAWFFFSDPVVSLSLADPTVLGLVFYLVLVSVNIALIHLMYSAVLRLRAEREVTAGLYEQQRIMFQELQHRVANNMQFVASLLSLQKRRIAEDSPEARAALEEARLRLETISRIHRKLYDPDNLDMPVGPYLQELCKDLLEASGAKNIVCLVDAPAITFSLNQLTTLSLLVAEIVTNSLKHAFPAQEGGTIAISIAPQEAGRYELTISDDGRGLPSEFDPETSKSLGFRIAQGLAAQLNGELTFSTNPGTTARLRFSMD